jgi:hypothetical protein
MQVKPIDSYYFVNDIKDHALQKVKLLDLINSLDSVSIQNNTDSISKTDWGITQQNQEYYTLVQELLDPCMQEISKYLCAKDYEVHNIWFQQYLKKDIHNWHNHSHANYASVYFLELSDKKFATEIYDLEKKSVINLDVKEGQVLTFPAHMLHRSPKLDSSRKTIISFNSSFYNIEISND